MSNRVHRSKGLAEERGGDATCGDGEVAGLTKRSLPPLWMLLAVGAVCGPATPSDAPPHGDPGVSGGAAADADVETPSPPGSDGSPSSTAPPAGMDAAPPAPAAAGGIVWVKSAGAPTAPGDTPLYSPETGAGIVALADGDVAITGAFWDTATFGRGEPGQTVLTSAGGLDVFVAKYRADDGSLGWVRRIGGAGDDGGSAAAAMPDGGMIVGGVMSGVTTFGTGEAGATTLGGPGVFIARYRADGTLVWVRRAHDPNGGSRHGLAGLAVAPGGSGIFATGDFGNAFVLGEGEPGQTSLVGGPVGAAWMARLRPDGSLAWARAAGPSAGSGVAALADGSAVFTGFLRYGSVFGKDEPAETTLASAGGIDVWMARYRVDGALLWARRAGGPGHEFATGIAATAGGGFAVAGTFADLAVFGAGESRQVTLTGGGSDVFLAQYDDDGRLGWVRPIIGAGSKSVGGIAATTAGDLLLTGGFGNATGDTLTFAPGEARAVVLTTAGENDVYLARYARDGTLSWARRAGGTGSDAAARVAALPDGSPLVTGTFHGAATFGAGEPGAVLLTSAGLSDIFLARHRP